VRGTRLWFENVLTSLRYHRPNDRCRFLECSVMVLSDKRRILNQPALDCQGELFGEHHKPLPEPYRLLGVRSAELRKISQNVVDRRGHSTAVEGFALRKVIAKDHFPRERTALDRSGVLRRTPTSFN